MQKENKLNFLDKIIEILIMSIFPYRHTDYKEKKELD